MRLHRILATTLGTVALLAAALALGHAPASPAVQSQAAAHVHRTESADRDLAMRTATLRTR